MMTQKSPSKFHLLHSIENNRTTTTTNSKIQNSTENVGINTDQIEFNREIGTNTPNYAEQMAKALENGNAGEEIVQMLMQNEPSDSYWKLITEKRIRAIDETVTENQQLHHLIDDLNKENDQLRVLSNHCDYLQNVLKSFTNEDDSLFDDSPRN